MAFFANHYDVLLLVCITLYQVFFSINVTILTTTHPKIVLLFEMLRLCLMQTYGCEGE